MERNVKRLGDVTVCVTRRPLGWIDLVSMHLSLFGETNQLFHFRISGQLDG